MCDCSCHANERELPDECFCTPECIRGEPPSPSDVLQAASECLEVWSEMRSWGMPPSQDTAILRREWHQLHAPMLDRADQARDRFDRVLSAYIQQEIRAYLDDQER